MLCNPRENSISSCRNLVRKSGSAEGMTCDTEEMIGVHKLRINMYQACANLEKLLAGVCYNLYK